MQRTTKNRLTVSLLALSSLASCGGGGGGGTSPGPNPNGPNVSAGADAVVAERDTVILSGSATQNANGGPVTTFQWAQLSGTPVMLMDATQQTARFVASELGTAGAEQLTFRFTATDDLGQSSSDDVMVMIQDARTAGGIAAFVATMNQSDQEELFVTDTRGVGAQTLVSGGVQHGNASSIEEFVISPDERWIAYLADERSDNVYEVFTARTDGSGSILAHAPLDGGDDIRDGSLRWSPTPDPATGEHRLAFVADITTNDYELYTVEPGTSSSVIVSGPITVSGGDVFGDIEWAPDGSRIAYRADAGVNGLDELFTTLPTTASNAIKVSATLQSAGDVTSFLWSPLSDQIAYRADAAVDNKFELFVSGATSSGAVRVSQNMSNNSDVEQYAFDPNPGETMPRIAYIADADTTGVDELYSNLTDGSDLVRESGPMVTGGDVREILWAPDGSQIGYIADQLQNEVLELFVASPGPLTTTTRLSGSMTGNGDVSRAFWSPTSDFVAYTADERTDGVRELFVSAKDGSSTVRASGTMTSGGDISNDGRDVRWSPTGDRVAYRADQNQDGIFQIFTSLPTTGFESNTVVSGRPAPGGSVSSGFEWSRDGGRLVYIADQDMNNVFELWSTGRDFEPITAAENPKLSGSLPTDTNGNITGDVQQFELRVRN